MSIDIFNICAICPIKNKNQAYFLYTFPNHDGMKKIYLLIIEKVI